MSQALNRYTVVVKPVAKPRAEVIPVRVTHILPRVTTYTSIAAD